MPNDTIAELAPFIGGTIEDRINLQARRNAKPQGLSGYRRQPQAKQQGQSEQQGAPSLAQQLMANAIVFRNDQGPISIQSSNDDWIALSDLPEQVQKVQLPQGYALGGFQRSMIKDPKQLELLDRWVEIRRQQKEAQMQQEEQSDPKFREQLMRAQAMGDQ
jgi:hypothetical protein